MSKTMQVILLVLAFVLCGALGYYLVGRLDNSQVDTSVGEEMAAEEVVDETEPVAVTSGAPVVTDVETPVYQPKTGLYVFRAHAEGSDVVFYLADEGKKTVENSAQPTTDALFEVQPTASGNYFVYVVDASGRKSEYVPVTGCKPKQQAAVKKVELNELASIFAAKNTGAARQALDGRISPSCKFNCTGLNESEEAPTSYVEIISRLKRSWESVTVTGIDYDAQGRISSVSLQVKQLQQ